MASKHIRRRQRNRHRSYTFVFAIIVLVCIYLLGQYYFELAWITDTITMILAIVAAVAFWLEYRDNKLLNEAQFIMELNQQFLSDQNLSDVEWMLEKYFVHFRKDTLTEEYEEKFESQFDLEDPNRQNLVKYLVHLEGIAALVNNGVIHLDAIDDLMSYRYFIAINNPIVQKLELLEYPEYYKGCIGLYEDWVKELLNQGITPPMYHEEENNLTKKCKQKSTAV